MICVELNVGQAGNGSACVMDIMWDELKINSINIDKETLSFYIRTCVKEEIYDMAMRRLDREYLPSSLRISMKK